MNRSVSPPSRPLKVFISYSHDDDDLRKELVKHLSQLRREGLIEDWHDRQITGGSDWADKIDDNLEAADIILLLVSASFLASDYCNDKEMARGLERNEARQTRVIPVILRPCDWHTAKFGKLQAFPTYGKPISKWQPVDDGYLEVAQGLRRVISESRRPMAPNQGTTPETQNFVMALTRRGRPWLAAAVAVLVAALALGGYSLLEAERNREFEAKKAALQQELDGRELDSLLAQAPKDPVLVMLDGDRHYRSDRPDQAKEAKDRYEKSIELDPKLADAHFRLGLLSDRDGNLPEAQAHYKEAMKHSPGTPKYQNNFAHTFLESRLYPQAIAEYGKIEKYILAGVEIAKARWALGDLPNAKNEQARALSWIAKPEIANLPRNKETWVFWIEDKKGGANPEWTEHRMVTMDEKRCYAGLSLAATLFLQAKDEEAKATADAAGCADSSGHVKEVLAADLIGFVEAVPSSEAERSSAFRKRYLSDAAQTGARALANAGTQKL